MSDRQLDRLWAGWRLPYIAQDDDARAASIPDGLTLFEGILASGLSDRETYIVWRGSSCFALLNAYPYTSGHVMVLPQRGVADLAQLSDAEHAELWLGVRCAVAAVQAAYSPHGVNVGLNLGEGSGAGVPDHLHVHVLPRWGGDTNFMTSVAEARVLPESLGDTWQRLVDVWPDEAPGVAQP
ncbi:MAG: HIT family protein [Acidimicrobiales bacterium]